MTIQLKTKNKHMYFQWRKRCQSIAIWRISKVERAWNTFCIGENWCECAFSLENNATINRLISCCARQSVQNAIYFFPTFLRTQCSFIFPYTHTYTFIPCFFYLLDICITVRQSHFNCPRLQMCQ